MKQSVMKQSVMRQNRLKQIIMRPKVSAVAVMLMMGCTSLHAQSVNLPDNVSIKPVLELTAGAFYSDKSYNNPDASGDVSWQEAYAKYGFEAEVQHDGGTFYGSAIGISSGTFGDGDAGGMTTGQERKTSLEEWTAGWRNGSAENASFDIRAGRQNIQIADGFVVAGDALNMGKGLADGELNRGGGYYLAARRSFDFAVQMKLQLNEQLKTQWYYLESDNKAQYQPTLWATDWQYQSGSSNLGLTYLQVTDLKDPNQESLRDDLKNVALRAKTQVNTQLAFNAEYVYQDLKHHEENAWYAALNYTFDQLPYQPVLGYRYSSFSENYDPLFYGNTDAGFGTWFQGEVAGNYAGPFSSNARIHQLSLQASVKENLHLGVLAYQFDTIKKANENLDGHEVDAFAVWSPTANINVIPLVGWYKPKKDISEGGSQVGGTGGNTYAQLILQYLY